MDIFKKILTSVTSFFLALVFSVIPMKEDALLLSVKAPVTQTSTEIVLVYKNKTGRSVVFCEDDYFAERKTENGWTAEERLNREAVREIATVIRPQGSHQYTITLTEPLDAGEYRITQTYTTEGFSLRLPFAETESTHKTTVEFTVS
ncbi:MAG: hypothetical protein IJU56_04340 [Clostridia bacterium]|nr:hypothetical protein [Clostridia bacterium]